MNRAVVLLMSSVIILTGCNPQHQPIDPPTNEEAKTNPPKQRENNIEPGTILVANSDGAACVDVLSFRELLKRITADDDIGMKELYRKGRLFFFDKGQRFRLIDTYRVPLEATDGTKHYRLQVRAIGGPLADKELYVLSMLVTPESKPTDADDKNKQ